MYLTDFRKEYLDAVVALEQKVYPEELVLGRKELWEECGDRETGCSVCGFQDGELRCYILASIVRKADDVYIYISDLNCVNPKFLQRLLMFFFTSHRRRREKFQYAADLRENSYRLLKKRSMCEPGCVHILEDIVEPGFYPNGEDAHKVRFMVDLGQYIDKDWRIAFRLEIDRFHLNPWNDFLNDAIHNLDFAISKGIDITLEENIKFIYKCLEERIIGYYQMFGKRIPAVGVRELRSREKKQGISAYEKSIRTLEKHGYQNLYDAPRRYLYDEVTNTLRLSAKFEAYNTKYPDTLCGCRWLYRKEKKFAERYENTEYYDRYGIKRELIPVPYMYRKKLLYRLEKFTFECGLTSRLNLNWDERECMVHICEDIWYLLRKDDAIYCMESIVSHYEPSVWNYFHDWRILVGKVKKAVGILTDGAMKTIFSSSYNQAYQICEKLESIDHAILNDETNMQVMGTANVRKQISSAIRKCQDIDQFIRELTETLELQFVKSMRIPKRKEKEAETFLERMQKYCPTVTLRTVFERFGRKSFLAYLSGSYPCVFSQQVFYLPYEGFISFVQNELRKRTKQMRHVYFDLKVNNLLAGIIAGVIDAEQYNKILQILKNRNVSGLPDILRNMAGFRFVLEQKGSPEFLTAGDASVCCMGFFSVKAKVYATEKGFGILNAYYYDRVIANSLVWINEPYNCLVLDNIEVNPNYVKYREQLRMGFLQSVKQIMQQYHLDFAVQGMQYNDLFLYYEDFKSYQFAKKEARGVEKPFYSDADWVKIIQSSLTEKQLTHLFEMVKKGEQEEREIFFGEAA